MTYGIYLISDQPKWYRDNYSSDNKLTGTIYTNQQLTVVKDLTGYTIRIRLSKGSRWGDHFDKTGSIVSATAGTWEYAVNQNEMPPPGIYRMVIEIAKSGAKETTLNRQELMVMEGPST